MSTEDLKKLVVILIIIVGAFLVYKVCYKTDIKKIKGIPEIPGAKPIFGHLLSLGDDHATVCERWWREYNWPVFQMKLGNTRAVVVNSWDEVNKMVTKTKTNLIDRPTLYTFHGVISSTQGFTIGSSPWDESCKNKRKAVGDTLNKGALKNYLPMFDLETYCLLRDVTRDCGLGEVEIEIRPYIQRLALNTTLTLCYGIRMDSVYDNLLREILTVGSAISLLRSASENLQDYIPALRYIPNNKKTKRSKELRIRRDSYLGLLMDKVKKKIELGTDKPCITGAILKDEEKKLNNVEVNSICLSLVSGGFETIPGTLTSCIGSLSTPEGQKFQDTAYADIERHFPNIEDAWLNCTQDETIPYINALVKEAGRYYTVSAMSLPRKTMRDTVWNGAVIPAKTMVLINAQAANHDTDYFGEDAGVFNPERYMDEDGLREKEMKGLPHQSFGGGARSCSGQYIAQRLIYASLVRLLSVYKIVASEGKPPNTDYADYNQFKTALVAIPKDFKVKLIPRKPDLIPTLLKNSEVRTADFYEE